MNKVLLNHIEEYFGTSDMQELDQIQELWSGYGSISRWRIRDKTFIFKHICVPTEANHPRGWNTEKSHQRKLKSYEVEMAFYQQFIADVIASCRIAKHIHTATYESERIIILEDLDASGYAMRRSDLNVQEVKLCLSWLAQFHGHFMGVLPKNLWEVGTYWHLETRPDEFQAMDEGWLKKNAEKIDALLNSCKHQTLVHGDAKVANFCFSEDMNKVSAVDFQYVGGGCGIKDVAYLLGSCLSEFECELYETELLDFYFSELQSAYGGSDFKEIEQEWRMLFPIAWADFTRFLLGWMPTHQKVNGYSLKMVERARDVLC